MAFLRGSPEPFIARDDCQCRFVTLSLKLYLIENHLKLLYNCDDVLPGFRESRQESVVFCLYEDSKLRREEDKEEGA